jgi:hypothetical protein
VIKVEKETRNYSIVTWESDSLNIDECQFLHDQGYRPVYAEMKGHNMEILCEKIALYGEHGLH